MRISDWSSDVCSSDLFGRANIDGRPVVASADDFTVRGGAADAALHRKFIQCEAMAHEYRLPLIRMIDGTGGGGWVRTLEDMGYPYIPHVRSEERSVGKECVSQCRSWWSRYH